MKLYVCEVFLKIYIFRKNRWAWCWESQTESTERQTVGFDLFVGCVVVNTVENTLIFIMAEVDLPSHFNNSSALSTRSNQATVLSHCIWQLLTGGVISDSVGVWRAATCRWQTSCSSTKTNNNHTTCVVMLFVVSNLSLHPSPTNRSNLGPNKTVSLSNKHEYGIEPKLSIDCVLSPKIGGKNRNTKI